MKKLEMMLLAAAGLAVAVAAAASETLTYSYDARGRLVRVQHNGSVNANVVTNYSYDKADNRALRNVGGAP
jgi:YD repeat-containing protein